MPVRGRGRSLVLQPFLFASRGERKQAGEGIWGSHWPHPAPAQSPQSSPCRGERDIQAAEHLNTTHKELGQRP